MTIEMVVDIKVARKSGAGALRLIPRSVAALPPAEIS
jgi:hypothetical protein